MLKENTETLSLGMVLELQTGFDSEASGSCMFAVIYRFAAIWMSLLFPGEQLRVLEWDELKNVRVWKVQLGA